MDATSRTAALYYRLPVFAQNLALAAAAIPTRRTRFGPAFARRLDFLRASAAWDRDRIDEYRDRQVAALVKHAYEETAYYRRVMDERGLRPGDIRGVADLPKLPVLTKDAIRANFEGLVSSRVKRRRMLAVQTSGTTGAPLQILTTREALAFKWAVWWRHREWFGFQRGDLHANVITKPLVSPGRSRPPYWRWNHLESQAIIPMQQVVPAKVEAIIAFLDRTPFAFYAGYPSILHSLAVLASDRGLSLSNGPRMVFSGAEAVLDHQRRDLQRFSGAEIVEMYGFNEGAGNASSCPEGNLHEDFEFGHLECVDPVVDESGIATGAIAATGFSTAAFPLIRYDVGDVGRWMPAGYRCPCGRAGQVIAGIEGRWEDHIVTPDGHQARRLGEIFKEMPNLKQFQLYQDDPQRVTLRLVVRDSFSARDEETLRRRVGTWISTSLEIDFDYVDAIAPAASGKYQRIVSTLGGRHQRRDTRETT